MRWCNRRFLLTLSLSQVLGATLIVGSAHAATVGDPVVSRSEEARTHYEAGRYDQALRAYRDALVERPESAALHLNVGDALYKLGDYEQALQEFERVAVAPNEDLAARGLYNKGNTHFQLQDFGAAVESYQEALAHNPNDLDSKANLELALQMLQQPPPESQQGDSEEESEQDSDPSTDPSESEQEQAVGEESAEPESGEPEDSTDEGEQNEADESTEKDSEAEEEQAAEAQDESDGEMADDEMDEEEAEQLLDALRDRDAQSQDRRYRAKRRRDDAQDW
jgi:Ca-activated chloride channel family protein